MKKGEFVEKLKIIFPQFRDFDSIVDYYAEYEFPEIQGDLFSFWKQVLKFVNAYFNTLVINQKEVYELFRIHGLQPKPIIKVIQALYQKKEMFGLSEIQEVYGSGEGKQKPEPEKKGIVKTLLGYFYQPKKEEVKVENEVLFKETVDRRLNDTYYFLRENVFKDTQIHQEYFVTQMIKLNKKLDEDSGIILNILEIQKIIKRVKLETPSKTYRVIVFSGDRLPLKQEVLDLQLAVFQLKLRLNQVNHSIEQVYPQIKGLTDKAKQMLIQGNKNVSKNFIRQKVTQQKFLATLINKRQIINNTLNQLLNHNLDNNLISTIKSSQDYIKSVQIDLESLEDIKMTNEEIKFNLDQADKIYKEVAGSNNDEDELYRQIESQFREEREKEVEKEKGSWKQREQGEVDRRQMYQ